MQVGKDVASSLSLSAHSRAMAQRRGGTSARVEAPEVGGDRRRAEVKRPGQGIRDAATAARSPGSSAARPGSASRAAPQCTSWSRRSPVPGGLERDHWRQPRPAANGVVGDGDGRGALGAGRRDANDDVRRGARRLIDDQRVGQIGRDPIDDTIDGSETRPTADAGRRGRTARRSRHGPTSRARR
jgi:hypothetical protein